MQELARSELELYNITMAKTNTVKRSLQATNLANDVIAKIKNKEKINLTQLQVSNGYSIKSSKAQKGIQTKTFQDLVVPVIEKMRALHVKSIDALSRRNLDKERLDSVINLSKQMIHDTQLLSGKSTENIANNIVVFGEDDFLSKQLDNK